MRYVLYARMSRQMICESFDATDDMQATTYAGEAIDTKMQMFDGDELKAILCDFDGAIVWRLGDQAAVDRASVAV